MQRAFAAWVLLLASVTSAVSCQDTIDKTSDVARATTQAAKVVIPAVAATGNEPLATVSSAIAAAAGAWLILEPALKRMFAKKRRSKS